MEQHTEIGTASNASVFSDLDECIKRNFGFPTKIRVRSGEAIDGIQVFYKDGNNQELEFPMHGNPKGGTAEEFTLQKNEYITAIEGVSASYWNDNFIISLTFYISNGNVIHFGMDENTAKKRGKLERIECAGGSAVLCFYGSTKKVIDATIPENQRPELLKSIGIYSQKISSEESTMAGLEEKIDKLKTLFPGLEDAIETYESSNDISKLFDDVYDTVAGDSGRKTLSAEEKKNPVVSITMAVYDKLINATDDDIGKEVDKLFNSLGNTISILSTKGDKTIIQNEIAKSGVLAAGKSCEYLGNALVMLNPVPMEGEGLATAIKGVLAKLGIKGSIVVLTIVTAIAITVAVVKDKNSGCKLIVINELDEDIIVEEDYCQRGMVSIRPKIIPRIISNNYNNLSVNVGIFLTKKENGSIYGSEYGVKFRTNSGLKFAYGVECPSIVDNNCACGFDMSAKQIARMSDDRGMGDMNVVKGNYEVIIRRKARWGSTAYFIARIRKLPERVAQTSRENWMNKLSDELYLGQINMPGSHDAAAIRTGIGHSAWSCHDRTITEQLKNGIRVMDVRIAVIENGKNGSFVFNTCHGAIGSSLSLNMFQSLRSLLDEVEGFLKSHPREAVVLLLKIDDWKTSRRDQACEELQRMFQSSVYIKSADMPKLREARGRVFLINRINESLKLGAPLSIEKCQVGESGKIAHKRNFMVYVEDLYSTSPSNKFKVVKETIHWKPTDANLYKTGVKLNYASAVHGPAFGVYILKEIIQYLGEFLANDIGNPNRNRPVWLGWFMMDYEEDSLKTDRYGYIDMTSLIIDSNMRNRQSIAYPSFPDKYTADEVLKPLP